MPCHTLPLRKAPLGDLRAWRTLRLGSVATPLGTPDLNGPDRPAHDFPHAEWWAVRTRLGGVMEIEDTPALVRPVVIAAFEGWNDAAESASAVVDHLMTVWN